MKKLWTLVGGLTFLSTGALAQRGTELSGLPKRTFEEALNHSNVIAFLGSPEFQMVMTVVVVLSIGAWLFYFWVTFQMGRVKSEIPIWTMIRTRLFATNPKRTRYRSSSPNVKEALPSVPRLHFHRSQAPLLAAGHESNELASRPENGSAQGRGR